MAKVGGDAMHDAEKYVCCFCGGSIPSSAPTLVVLSLEVPGGGTQGLYAHQKCLRASVHPSVPLGALEDDGEVR